MTTGAEAPIAYAITKAAIAALAKPAMRAAFSGLTSVSEKAVDIFGDRLTDYLSHQAERHSCLSTIVFGHQKSLHDLYIPLTVVAGRLNGREEILVDRFQNDFIPKNSRVLITDTAGMGKSTLSKFLFLQCLRSAYAIPFFVELRHLSSKNDIYALLLKQLNPLSTIEDEPRFNKRQLQRLLKTGSLLFFFDGYDEISPADREAVTISIKELIELYPKHLYVITSRPESGLLAFPNFRQFTIRPLQRDESFALIRRYDEGDAKDPTSRDGRAEQLIKKLQGPDFSAVHEFLKNPLLTSLLYRSFEYKQSVPLKKHVFYRQVFDALFDWHDATKEGYNTREKKSGLDIDSFHRMLRVIGFLSVLKGQVEGDADTVLGWIRKAKAICNLSSFPESHFLDDLVRAVPVFAKDGDHYRWSHKSLSEYFAAQYMCTEGKQQQGMVLSTLLSTRQIARFVNVLDQIYDIDNAGFREHLVLPAAKAFTTYWAQSYRGLDPAIPDGDVRLRKATTFDVVVIFFPEFKFEKHEDFRKVVGDISKRVTGEELGAEPVGAVFLSEGSRKYSKLIVTVPGPLNTVLQVLASKKDPLVRPSTMIFTGRALATRPLRVATGPSPEPLTDNPQAAFNDKATFAALTQTLVSTDLPVVDADKMLQFESSFEHSQLLSSITDELLQPIRGTG